ncbi:MAG: methyl-accepting chemotaxis protein [Rhodocyclaceae bacterium]|nr:methyl-accepting chemotaxis protein [Rhodocyclaceae bacterium]
MLKAKILGITALIILAMVAVLGAATYFIKDNADDAYRQATLEANRNLLNKIIANSVGQMEFNITAITRNTEALAALQEANLEVLKESSVGSYNRLSSGGTINFLHLFDTQGNLVLSHGLTDKQTIGRSQLVSHVIAQGKSKYGLEISGNNELVVSFAFPLFLRGTQVGICVMSKGFASILAEVAKANHAETAIVTFEGKIENTTNKPLFDALTTEFEALKSESFSKIKHAETHFGLSNLPMMNNEGQALASFVVLKDHTQTFTRDTWIKIIAIVGCLGVFAACLAFLYSYINRAFHPLEKTVIVMRQVQEEGDFSRRVEIHNKDDEVGLASTAFNNLMETLQSALSDTNLVMEAVAIGDFNRRVEGEVRGDLNHLKESVNASVDTLERTMVALHNVMNSLCAGDFSQRMDASIEGELKLSVDHAMQTMQTMLDDVGNVMSGVAQGDLTCRVSAQGQGDFARLKQDINASLDVLEQTLADIAFIAQALSDGDLTQSITQDYPGVFGQTKDGINATVANVTAMIVQIRESAAAINLSAREIAAGNQDLSVRTEEQATSLEATATSLSKLNATVRDNADNARQAKELAQQSNETAASGGAMVKRVATTMEEIQGSSRKIADIISVIDSIAFQTNILALNAAVEAARAGEQGRGFAVVASEVRNLAQRSATAAKEIKALIAESSDRVNVGTKSVQEAGQTMDDVVTSFDSVANLVTEISEASREQSVGIDQVTRAVSQMDEVTQQNAALVEEAAAAAENLEEQARNLVQSMNMFKLTETPNYLPTPALRNVTPLRLRAS